MAVITRRYVFQGTTDEDLQAYVGATVAVVRSAQGVFDVQVDNAETDGIVEALDGYMARRGYVLEDPAVASSTMGPRAVDSAGTVWEIQVSTLGVVTAVAI